MVSWYFFVGSHWKYWHIINYNHVWCPLVSPQGSWERRVLSIYCCRTCLMSWIPRHRRDHSGSCGENMGKLLACGVFWFMRFLNVCQPKSLSLMVKLWISKRIFRLIISMIWGGKIARVHGYANDIQWLLSLKPWRRLDRVSRSSRRFRNPPKQPPFWM